VARRSWLLLATVVAGGVGLSVQAFLNGRLTTSVGSAEIAATVNNVVGLACLIALGVAIGAPRRALRSLRTAAPMRWWHPVMGVNGAFFIAITAYAAPEVGVALVTVAIVCGQMAGSLLIDGIGLSPAGRRPLTINRALGAALAVVAVGIGATQTPADVEVGLLLLVAAAGVGMAFQQAAIGHVNLATGEPVVASGVNFLAGAVAIIVVALVVNGLQPPNGWDASPGYWIGGVIGATAATIMAWAVNGLGVLRLSLAIIAGQSIGALAIDIIAPPPGEEITVLTFASLALVIVAVVIGSRTRQRAAVA
jgi:transporter family-2 protein